MICKFSLSDFIKITSFIEKRMFETIINKFSIVFNLMSKKENKVWMGLSIDLLSIYLIKKCYCNI